MATDAQTALTLDLYARADHVRPEERGFYLEFNETLYTELSPEGILEQSLASEIAGSIWRLRRCSSAEAELGDFDESTDKIRRSIERARSQSHSTLHRSINQLRRLRTERACRLALNADADDAGNRRAFDASLTSICGHSAKAESVGEPQIGRNAACPCNSGQKYKRCCGRLGAGWPTLSAQQPSPVVDAPRPLGKAA
jgi:hypothetical protein